jgi:hypothetical protein
MRDEYSLAYYRTYKTTVKPHTGVHTVGRLPALPSIADQGFHPCLISEGDNDKHSSLLQYKSNKARAFQNGAP